MHKEGHIGLGFLVYAPFAFAAAYYELYAACLLGVVGMQYWSHFPDIDLHVSFLTHRGITHTFATAIAAGVVTAGTGVALLATDVLPATLFTAETVDISAVEIVGGLGFLVGFLGVVSHILGDLFTPMGVKPARPLSDAEFSLNLFRAANKTANRAFSKVGLYAVAAAFVLGVMASTGALQEVWTQLEQIIENLDVYLPSGN